MMSGLVPITVDEYAKYFESSKDYYYMLDISSGASFSFSKADDLVVAFRDKNDECFSRSLYWKI